MAEGDTVHRIARCLSQALGRGPIERAESPNPRAVLSRASVSDLEGREVELVEAHGKHLLIALEGGRAILSHLGMNGSWRVVPRRGGRREERSSAWLVLVAGEVEARQHGGPRLRLSRGVRRLSDVVGLELGPDPLRPDWDPQKALQSLRRAAGHELGEALLDQSLIAGVGNVHKSEACFAARLDPWARVRDVPAERLGELLAIVARQMARGVETGRRPGSVHRRAGRPCPACGARIRSRGQGDANRTTYWCPRCQAPPEPPG